MMDFEDYAALRFAASQDPMFWESKIPFTVQHEDAGGGTVTSVVHREGHDALFNISFRDDYPDARINAKQLGHVLCLDAAYALTWGVPLLRTLRAAAVEEAYEDAITEAFLRRVKTLKNAKRDASDVARLVANLRNSGIAYTTQRHEWFTALRPFISALHLGYLHRNNFAPAGLLERPTPKNPYPVGTTHRDLETYATHRDICWVCHNTDVDGPSGFLCDRCGWVVCHLCGGCGCGHRKAQNRYLPR